MAFSTLAMHHGLLGRHSALLSYLISVFLFLHHKSPKEASTTGLPGKMSSLFLEVWTFKSAENSRNGEKIAAVLILVEGVSFTSLSRLL